MKVNIERSLEQVVDGKHYSCEIKFDENKLDVDIRFNIAIPDLDTFKSLEELKSAVAITVSKDDENIELSDKEYIFFFDTMAHLAIEFYNNPQTRDSQLGIMGNLLQGKDRYGQDTGMPAAKVGMRSSGTAELADEFVEILVSKFKCSFQNN